MIGEREREDWFARVRHAGSASCKECCRGQKLSHRQTDVFEGTGEWAGGAGECGIGVVGERWKAYT